MNFINILEKKKRQIILQLVVYKKYFIFNILFS